MTFSLASRGTLSTGTKTDLRFEFQSQTELKPGARCWLLHDIWQNAGRSQTESESLDNFVTMKLPDGTLLHLSRPERVRALDLYPVVPEMTWMVEGHLEGVRPGEIVEICVRDWLAPSVPIKKFQSWLVVDRAGKWDFSRIGFKDYREFVLRGTKERVSHEAVKKNLLAVALEIKGEHQSVPPANRRKTPGVFWGELHGMAFGQRPLDDFYNYAKNVTALDFCSAVLFSYSSCVENVWQDVKDTARRHSVEGKFVAFVGFEGGTPPDDSHRCAYFPKPEGVPPIFCEGRPPAQNPMLQKRFHPETAFCKTVDEFYSTVKRFGGFVGGHFHTRTYGQEVLAEIWQKQKSKGDEESRIFELLREGMRMGIVAGSDTHDSMPGSPYPESGTGLLVRPAGFTGVWADELTVESLTEAFLARRVFATSGARMLLKFESEGKPMGSELPLSARRRFSITVDGTAPLSRVELLKGGYSIKSWKPGCSKFEISSDDEEVEPVAGTFYLLRAKQADGHLGWTSPIWFG